MRAKIPQFDSPTQPHPSSYQENESSLLRWFYNLPVRSKQLTGLFTSEVLSIVGLVGVGAVLIVVGGRTQLRQQAQSELVVTEINYNIKIDQMGFGFRGQSDNPAIIKAASDHSSGKSVNELELSQVKLILQNEIKARQIEYATLVGSDKKIIANANINRAGQSFDPNNLVSQVLRNPEQIKTSQIVSRQELLKESPPLPEGFTQPEALIRYTVTPVKGQNGQVVGVLVSGDIVNGKSPIVENTINAFDGGYSAVYAYQPSGEFTLATALDQAENLNGEPVKSGEALSNKSLLEKATEQPGKIVTARKVVGEQTYTMAAKAITDANQQPVAVLVRGTPETALNTLLGNSLLLQLVVSVLALSADVLLAILLGRSIGEPIKDLQETTQKFANGDRRIRAKSQNTDELGQLAETFNELADKIVFGETSLAQQLIRQRTEAERSQFFADFTSRLYQSLTVEDILSTSIEEIRTVLQAERILIYRLNSDLQGGEVTSESIAPGWTPTKGRAFNETLWEGNISTYRNERVWVSNNLEEVNLSTEQRQIFEALRVKASMVAPILQDDQPVAFLCVHQCSGIRIWQQEEVAFLRQLATQTSFALKQANLIEQLERARREAELGRQKAIEFSQVEQARQIAELTSSEQRQQKEELQRQVIALLSDIEGSVQGDLTVRAEVTDTEIGTVADFFNAIVENQRQIVMQVKQASTQVNSSLRQDEQAVGKLSEQALQQAEEINLGLESLLRMTYSVQAVAENARQAAAVAHTASQAAETGGVAIDGTVENIMNLQAKVVGTADKVKILGESSQQIAKVVSLVQQISLKTNLLSINAGIEANRSGEEGEGFRVIATQIGELATQSVSATAEIEKVIDVIMRGTKEVVEAMEEGRTHVVDSARLVVDAKQSMEKIVEVSRQIDNLVQSISSETVSQAQTSEEVTALMQEIARFSQVTSESSRQVCGNLQQTVEVAEQLQRSVGRFKIDSHELQ
ncbi:methyl-accepting chemotaxis protein [Lyngbya aestuarii]|uniref:methyl-accepting chemotaxis protein n=1 Tax=Lyngbya aestuarii TaxID=118322 RepID=UPI00403D84F8